MEKKRSNPLELAVMCRLKQKSGSGMVEEPLYVNYKLMS